MGINAFQEAEDRRLWRAAPSVREPMDLFNDIQQARKLLGSALVKCDGDWARNRLARAMIHIDKEASAIAEKLTCEEA